MNIKELLKNKIFVYTASGMGLAALTLAVTFSSILPNTNLLQANSITVGSQYVSCVGKLDPKTTVGESIKVTWTVSAATQSDATDEKMQIETDDMSLKSWEYCIKNTVTSNKSCGGSMKSTPTTVKLYSTYPSSDNGTTKTMLPYIHYVYQADDDHLFPDDDYIKGPTCSLKLTQNPAPAPAAPTYKSQTSVPDSTDPNKMDVTIEWNVVTGASSYKIKSSSSPAGPWTTIVNSTTTPKTTIQNLGPGSYYYTITATKNGTESVNGTPILVLIAAKTSAPAPLAAPTGFFAWPETPNATDPTKFDVTLTWWPVLNATGYNIKSASTSDGQYFTVFSPTSSVCQFDANFQAVVCKQEFKAVLPGTYYDVVTATKTGSESPNSLPITVVVGDSQQTQQGAATCSGSQVTPKAGDTKLKVNWTAALTGVNLADVSSVAWTSVAAVSSDPAPPNGITTQTTYDVSLLDQSSTVGAYATANVNGQPVKSPICTADLTAPPEAQVQTPADTDNDGTPDTEDACPTESANTSDGCPDVEQETQQGTQELSPALNLMTCKAGGNVVNRTTEENLYVNCTFTQPAIVNAFVVKGDYDPKNPPEDATVKQFLTDEYQPVKPLTVSWDGVDDYDSPVENGDYTLIISAVPDKSYEPDYSILKFKVTDEPGQAPTQEVTPEQPASPQPQTPPPAPPVAPPPPPKPSKCPGVNYPTDIAGHWAENFIKESYDACLLTGYSDGTFRPDQKITRAETVKFVLAANNVAPKVCYDNDCGSPYIDLDTWQGPWIRPAWDLKIINKTGTRFEPDKSITRAEAASVVVKGFKFPTLAFCYTANCGAGFPSNFFNDIKESWQGPYIRSLWDKGVVQGTFPNMFEPNRSITRAEITKMVIASRAAVK